MNQLTLNLLTGLTDINLKAVRNIKEEMRLSIEHLEEKESELEANEYLVEDSEWREIYLFEKGYFAALEFCLGKLTW